MVTPTVDDENQDAFGKLIADGTANELDLSSHYSFNAERLRLFKNGSRAFPQYNSLSTFSDDADVWTLKPSGGDTMHIESAESVTYIVNYVIQASHSLKLNQSLSDGDVLRFGPYNGSDGWLVEQRGADHSDTQVDIIQSVAGTEETLKSDVTIEIPTTDWTRYECKYNWYGVGNQIWTQTYTDSGDQVNNQFAKTSKDGERGPETGNLNLWYELQADASTTGLELESGSTGAITLGQPVSLTRDKPQYVSLTASGTADTWEPQYAIRLDPDKPNVNGQLAAVEILNYGNASNLELLAISVDPTNTDAVDSDFSTPDYHHDMNSAMQEATSISKVPNTSGTKKDLTSSEKPGGHTIATAVDIDVGKASETSSTANQNRQEKKRILASDQVVFLTRTGNTGGTLDFVWDVDQNW